MGQCGRSGGVLIPCALRAGVKNQMGRRHSGGAASLAAFELILIGDVAASLLAESLSACNHAKACIRGVGVVANSDSAEPDMSLWEKTGVRCSVSYSRSTNIART